MKHTVQDWTAIQTRLPNDLAGDALWKLIEDRTWAKYGYQRVPIALDKPNQLMVEAAKTELIAEGLRFQSV